MPFHQTHPNPYPIHSIPSLLKKCHMFLRLDNTLPSSTTIFTNTKVPVYCHSDRETSHQKKKIWKTMAPPSRDILNVWTYYEYEHRWRINWINPESDESLFSKEWTKVCDELHKSDSDLAPPAPWRAWAGPIAAWTCLQTQPPSVAREYNDWRLPAIPTSLPALGCQCRQCPWRKRPAFLYYWTSSGLGQDNFGSDLLHNHEKACTSRLVSGPLCTSSTAPYPARVA